MNLLVGHLVGDILFQNRYLAKIKRKSVWGMILHCAIYAFVVWLFTMWHPILILIVGLSHYLIDRFSLGKIIWPILIDMGNPENTDPHPMWLGLVCDQSLHLLALYLISKL